MADFPRWLKPVTLWLLAGTVLFLAVQAWQSHGQRTRFSAHDGVIEIRRSPDGHFHWPARVNGREVDFLVDTGATRTALPASLAEGLTAIGSVRSDTAGGVVDGESVLPEGWIAAATRKQADINSPGEGYGYQWWTWDDGSYQADGIFGQGIFIDPNRNLVIASNASWTSALGLRGGEWEARREFYRQVQRAVDRDKME